MPMENRLLYVTAPHFRGRIGWGKTDHVDLLFGNRSGQGMSERFLKKKKKQLTPVGQL